MRVGFGMVIAAGILVMAAEAHAAFTPLNVADRRDYAFDKTGILYISTTGGSVLRYNTLTNTYLSPFVIGGTLNGIDLAPDGLTLAVADTTTQGANNRIHLVNTVTGTDTPVSFVRDFGESGTYMVAWGSDGQLLVSGSFSGSGWVPLRRYNPGTGQTTTVASVRQDSMLTPSGDRNTIGIAESNSSAGPINDYNVLSKAYEGTVDTGWFTFEVAVDRDGDKFVVPTYNGAFVYNHTGSSFTQQGIVGQYANHGPIAAVFSPVSDYFFTSEWAFTGTDLGVRVYDQNTLARLATLDPYSFDWNGNHAMGSGRMEISPDGRWLVVSVDGGARLYNVSAYAPEPSSLLIIAFGGLLLARSRRR
ncbi:MAG TPA: hypothetical protein VGP94_15045 [Tepidisphaeraceae bacterium]|jgi:WD40 repeat protein|nr:hypothetical protein [Tepidisphaeraceae bacterium]